MSVSILLENKQRLGQAHYLQKIKKAEDELNSAFNHLCKVVADTGIIANLQFNPEDKEFAVNIPLKRRIDTHGVDLTQHFVDEVIGEHVMIDGGVPKYCVRDVLQISVSGDPTEKITEDKISVSLTTKLRPGSEDTDPSYSINFQGLNDNVLLGSGGVTESQYNHIYYWVEPAVLKTLKTKLSQEVEVLDQVQKYRTWIKDPKAKDSSASDLFKEMSDLLEVFKDTLAKQTPGNQQPEAIRRMDGFLLYCEKVGLIDRYSDAIQDRFQTFDGMKRYFSLESGVLDVKSGLPVVKKYSEFKDIGGFLTWLYSFWGSASNQSFAGRATAILCSKPKSGPLGKPGAASNQKPTGSKGKGKGKEASSKKTSQGPGQKGPSPRGSKPRPSNGKGKKGSKRKNN